LIIQGRLHEYKPPFSSLAQNSLESLSYQFILIANLELFPSIHF